MNDVEAAKILIKCLDLTSLDNKDTEAKIEKLCQKAQTPCGNVAAVCIFPKFIPSAKEMLKKTDIKIATVVNFPKGETKFDKITVEIKDALKAGADEIDAVFPYKNFLNGDIKICEDFLKLVRNETKKHTLKIILETGELKKAAIIKTASEMCIKNNADFIKTSTGKTETSATPEAANAILETIAASKTSVGFKASGGIKTAAEAKKYLTLANAIMGFKWAGAKNFRIGASSLLDDLLNTVERGY